MIMFDYSSLYQLMQQTRLEKWSESLPEQLAQIFSEEHADHKRWQKVLQQLPEIKASEMDCQADNLQIKIDDPIDEQQLQKLLQQLKPWRKGPYQINDLLIDSEWHSDWKWNRIIKHLSPLKNRSVLDIGCGNGYHCWTSWLLNY